MISVLRELPEALHPATSAASPSLGDRACLALARERGLAAERRQPDVAAQAGIVFEVIR